MEVKLSNYAKSKASGTALTAPNFLTESYIIRQMDSRWQALDRMSFLSKNVYNVANYVIRQAFFADRKQGVEHDKKRRSWDKMLNFIRLKETIRREYPDDYHALPKRVTETGIKAVISMWRGYDASWFDWKQSPHKYMGEPRIPRYKKVGNAGRAQILWNQEAVSKLAYKKHGVIRLSGCDVSVVPGQHIYDQIRKVEALAPDDVINLHDRIAVVKVSPRYDHYLVTITYQISSVPYEHLDPTQVMGIDLGVNNLMAITSNKTGFKPIPDIQRG